MFRCNFESIIRRKGLYISGKERNSPARFRSFFFLPKDGGRRSYRETLAQTCDGGPEENYVHALPASGSPVFREIWHGGGLHRGDDEARAEGQLHLQTYRRVVDARR